MKCVNCNEGDIDQLPILGTEFVESRFLDLGRIFRTRLIRRNQSGHISWIHDLVLPLRATNWNCPFLRDRYVVINPSPHGRYRHQ